MYNGIVINGVREQAYWVKRPGVVPLTERGRSAVDGTWVVWPRGIVYRTVPALGPGLSVLVRHDGIEVVTGRTGRPYRPGYARWLANRLVEAAALCETIGGDGTEPGATKMRNAYAQDVADRNTQVQRGDG